MPYRVRQSDTSRIVQSNKHSRFSLLFKWIRLKIIPIFLATLRFLKANQRDSSFRCLRKNRCRAREVCGGRQRSYLVDGVPRAPGAQAQLQRAGELARRRRARLHAHHQPTARYVRLASHKHLVTRPYRHYTCGLTFSILITPIDYLKTILCAFKCIYSFFFKLNVLFRSSYLNVIIWAWPAKRKREKVSQLRLWKQTRVY